MMERTDRHFRYLVRLIEPRAWLYTEMIVASALVKGDAGRLLEFDSSEHPVAVQLGGADPAELVTAARLAAQAGYDEVNLNVGCPSDRVQAGEFGAALMLDPGRVAACVAALTDATALPVTVKTRLGVDRHDSYEFLHAFASHVAAAGCRTLIVHARKAWLRGLSPKQNRELPPLDYARVHRLKRDFPALEIVVNGGLTTAEAVLTELGAVDGVMLGRIAYRNPLLVGAMGRHVFAGGEAPAPSAVLRRYLEHVERELMRGTPLKAMTRHLTGLCNGRPGARHWRYRLAMLQQGRAGLEQLQSLIEGFDSDECVTEKMMHRFARSRYNDRPENLQTTR